MLYELSPGRVCSAYVGGVVDSSHLLDKTCIFYKINEND